MTVVLVELAVAVQCGWAASSAVDLYSTFRASSFSDWRKIQSRLFVAAEPSSSGRIAEDGDATQ